MSDERRLVIPSANAQSLLMSVVGYRWSYDAIDAYKKAEFVRQMPELWRRMYAIHPLIPQHLAAVLCICAFPLCIFSFYHIQQNPSVLVWVSLVAAVALIVTGCWLQVHFTPARTYRWRMWSVEHYVRYIGPLPTEVAFAYKSLQLRKPLAHFQIEVLGDDPILWASNLGPLELELPIMVWGPDGKIIPPPAS